MIREAVLAWALRTMCRPHDFAIGPSNDPYMLRWYITPWSLYDRSKPVPWYVKLLPSIYLHHFLHDDDDRALHDHPWPSISWLLDGCYWEVLFAETGPPDTLKVFRPTGSVHSRSASAAHRVVLDHKAGKLGRIEYVPAISLFFTGPVMREWGFHCPKGWVPWRQFVSGRDRGQPGKGCD